MSLSFRVYEHIKHAIVNGCYGILSTHKKQSTYINYDTLSLQKHDELKQLQGFCRRLQVSCNKFGKGIIRKRGFFYQFIVIQ